MSLEARRALWYENRHHSQPFVSGFLDSVVLSVGVKYSCPPVPCFLEVFSARAAIRDAQAKRL